MPSNAVNTSTTNSVSVECFCTYTVSVKMPFVNVLRCGSTDRLTSTVMTWMGTTNTALIPTNAPKLRLKTRKPPSMISPNPSGRIGGCGRGGAGSHCTDMTLQTGVSADAAFKRAVASARQHVGAAVGDEHEVAVGCVRDRHDHVRLEWGARCKHFVAKSDTVDAPVRRDGVDRSPRSAPRDRVIVIRRCGGGRLGARQAAFPTGAQHTDVDRGDVTTGHHRFERSRRHTLARHRLHRDR